MEICLGDKFKVSPFSVYDPASKSEQATTQKSRPRLVGTVVWVNPAHGVAVLQFKNFRECFSFYGSGGLYAAQRVGSR